MKLRNLEEGAEKARRTPKSMRNLVNRKQIPFRKIKGRIFFIEEELDQWILNSPGFTLEDYLRKEKKE